MSLFILWLVARLLRACDDMRACVLCVLSLLRLYSGFVQRERGASLFVQGERGFLVSLCATCRFRCRKEERERRKKGYDGKRRQLRQNVGTSRTPPPTPRPLRTTTAVNNVSLRCDVTRRVTFSPRQECASRPDPEANLRDYCCYLYMYVEPLEHPPEERELDAVDKQGGARESLFAELLINRRVGVG